MTERDLAIERRRQFLTRRRLLQVGGIGVLGLGLPELLRANAPRVGSTRSAGGSPKSCIFIVQYGGCSHIDSLDLKPDAPAEIRGPYRPLQTSVPGIQVGELLPKLARLAHRYCLVRSMSHDNPGHDAGMHIAMTGHRRPVESTPYFGSAMAKVRPATSNVPSYVWIQNIAGDVQPRYLNGGFLGAAYSPLRVGNDMDTPANADFRLGVFDPPADVSTKRLLDRRRLLAGLDTQHTLAGTVMQRYQERAVDLVAGAAARRAFDLNQESVPMRDWYGRHPLGQNLLLARRLVEAGVRLVSVTAWCGLAQGEKFTNTQTWDMHGPVAAHIGPIFGTGSFCLGYALPVVDQAVSALLTDLDQRGLLDDTLVVMVGEFGRTPRVNNQGRDHWAACYSALLAGAGIKGGSIYGASDKNAAYVKDNPVSPEAFGATLFHALGVPPDTRLGADGFTHPVSTGQPLLDLFG
jgi:hypothetical protein